VNLHQFQWINYFGYEENAWYYITEEAKDCYDAYFRALGTSSEETNEQIRAIELLSVLRTNTFLKDSKKDNDEEIKRRIQLIIDTDKFV
jgi:tryptophan 2,3-dioxygenase